MDREWMYKTFRLDPSYLEHVTKFIAAAKKASSGSEAGTHRLYM